jgi:hypothetical protein
MVELMTVSAIISILAAISFALLSRMRSQAIESKAIATLNIVATGYEMYFNRFREYPQWGPESRFDSPGALLNFLAEQEYIPRSYVNIQYDSGTGYIFDVAEDYAMEIPMYDSTDITTDQKYSYFVVFHPYNLQRDSLAVGINPPTGWVAVRPRKGSTNGNYRFFRLYIPHRGGA